MLKTAIVIPIKTNNQRLPGKNTKNLNGRPLYDYLFNTVKKCKKVDDIYIDSSSDEILSIAESYDFKTIERPESLNTPETSGNDLLNFELQHIKNDIICQVFARNSWRANLETGSQHGRSDREPRRTTTP